MDTVGFRVGAASIVVSILAVLSLAGCGSSAGHPAAVHAGVSRRAVSVQPNSTAASSAKARAMAFADAVSLTSADLSEPPAFKGSPIKEQGAETEAGELSRCAGAHRPRPAVAEVSSEEFKRKGPGSLEELYSTVIVRSTAALASKNLAASLSSSGEACIERELNKMLAKKDSEQINYSPVSMVDRPLEVSGVSGGVELEVATMVRKVGGTGNVYLDILGFVDGPAEVFLTAVGTPRPVTPTFEEHLISVLSKRARAHGD